MAAGGLASSLPRRWYERRLTPALWPLLPLSWLFAGLAGLRRWLFRCGVLRTQRLPAPVIVVGNLTVGGSGKTPLVLWLVERLREAGWRPGIISGGYGGSGRGEGVHAVAPGSSPALVGDEPLLLARRSGVPVFVGRDRVAAGQALLAAHGECDVIVSDDGLQHYRLARDLEIVLFDSRGVGNGWLLPAGPLREPVSRARLANLVIANGELPDELRDQFIGTGQFSMALEGARFIRVGGNGAEEADGLRGRRIHAVAGIGNPQRFFAHLNALGLEFEPHGFADHHAYCARDLAFAGAEAILMTEKDAVKCEAFADQVAAELWALRVDVRLDRDPLPLIEKLLENNHGSASA